MRALRNQRVQGIDITPRQQLDHVSELSQEIDGFSTYRAPSRSIIVGTKNYDKCEVRRAVMALCREMEI